MAPNSSPTAKKRATSSIKPPASPLHQKVNPPTPPIATAATSEDVILPNPTTPQAAHQATIAAIPMVAPPPVSAPNTVRYGHLNTKSPIFFIQAELEELRSMIQSAPSTIQRTMPSDASYDYLLNEVFRIRQHEAVNAKKYANASHADSLKKLMGMTTQQVMQLAQTNPDHLKKLMHSALIADPTLQPRNFPVDNNYAMAAIAVT